MHSVHLHKHDRLTVPQTVLLGVMFYYTVQLQAWRILYPISAQIEWVMTSHIQEFCHSFD